ncbi:MAG: flagellar biosynthetic protein FliR [Chloroflexota bacterium]|jgi:flagellar biosynthesis protein FliR
MPVELLMKYVPNFLLILLRMSIFVTLLPMLSSRNFPAQFKVGFVLALAFILTPVVDVDVAPAALPALVLREVVLGVALGLVARSVFLIVEMAGQVMSIVMGLSLATVFNPELGQSTEVSRMYGIIAVLIFLGTDAHHDMIYVLARSYEWLPTGQVSFVAVAREMVSLGSSMLSAAVKLSAPVVVVMLVSNLVLGFLYKAAPQMNVFFVGYPVFIFVGFLTILMGIPVFVQVSSGNFGALKDEMVRVLSLVRG